MEDSDELPDFPLRYNKSVDVSAHSTIHTYANKVLLTPVSLTYMR